MRLRTLVPALAGLLAALVPGIAAPPGVSAAPAAPVFNRLTSTDLPGGFAAIEVDGVTKRVFVSAPQSSVVTVLGYDGQVQGSIPVPGAGALLVDGGLLYVASTTAGRIDAFNTATLAPAGSYGGGSLFKPNALVKAGGKVWTTSGACAGVDRLVSIDTGTGTVTTQPHLPYLSDCPFLFTSPVDPAVIFGFEANGSGAVVVRLDVSSGSPVMTSSAMADGTNVRDGEVFPDGQTMGLAAGWPYEIRTMRTNPVEQFGVVYPTGSYPNAIEATAGAGGLVAAGRNGSYDPDIDVFRLGDPGQRFLQYDFGSTDNTLHNGGLAFSPDGVRLFAVSGPWDGQSSMLTVFGPGPEGGRYHPLTPARILDTRSGGDGGRIGPGATVQVQVAGQGGVPLTGVSAVAMNVTVTEPTATSYLTLFPPGNNVPPLASNLNFVAGQTIPNLVVVRLGANGKVSMYNAVGRAHVLFDVAGWYSSPAAEPEPTGRYTPVVPSRLLDTRSTGALAGGTAMAVQVTGRGGVPASGVSAVILNATVVGSAGAGFLTIFPTGGSLPLASDVNYATADIRPNLTVVKVGAGGAIDLYASTTTHVVIDVAGWMS